MLWPLTRRRTMFLVLGVLALGAGIGSWLKLRGDVSRAFVAPRDTSFPFEYVALPPAPEAVERWGGGDVDAVAADAATLFTAGGFGIAGNRGEVSAGLPTLRVSALTLWRGFPVAGLASGGLFLRRNQQWEELRTGSGMMHVRTLLESPGGELWIGAREGLFKAAWGARVMEWVDKAPVKSLAFAEGGILIAGGEEGLRKVEGGRATAMQSPDPWVEWVGFTGKELAVITPFGLGCGPLGAPLPPLPGAEEATSAAAWEGRLYAVTKGRLLRFEDATWVAEEFLPAPPRRVFAVQGFLFADTSLGLYRRTPSGWRLARPRPSSLPSGSSHISALAAVDSRIAVGLFNGGVLFGDPQGRDFRWVVGPLNHQGVEAEFADPHGLGFRWTSLPGSPVWGVNALLNAGGTLYVASLRGAFRFDGRALRPLEGKDTGAAFSLASTAGGIAVGYGQGVALPGSRFLSAFHGLPGNQALALASGDQLFVGTPSGLGAVSESKVLWRVVAGDGRLPHPWVTALAFFKDALFIGTYGGGAVRRTASKSDPASPGSFDPFVETEGFKVNPGCLVEAGGRLYLGTDGRGLFRLSEDGRQFLPLRVNLPSPRVTALLPGKGALFVGTDEGLARIPLPSADGR